MCIVAITREMGSLGTFIGAEVAARLGWEFVRDEITREAAREYDVDEERLIGTVEERPGLLEAVSGSARRYQALVASEVLDVARLGRVVLLGRWSTFLLRPVRHAVRVRVCASRETRVARVIERLGLGRAEALRRIEANDEGVRARVRQVFDVEWSDPTQYDLTIATDHLGFDTAVAEMLALVTAPEFQPTADSRQTLENLALAARVRATLKARDETAAVEIDIRADDGRVTLAGTVARSVELAVVLRVVPGVEGVGAVVNELRVIEQPPR